METSTGPPPHGLASKYYAGPVEILCGQVKFPINSIQIMGFGSRLWDLGIIGPVDKTVGFHAWIIMYLANLLPAGLNKLTFENDWCNIIFDTGEYNTSSHSI